MDKETLEGLLKIYNSRARSSMPKYEQAYCYFAVMANNCRQGMSSFAPNTVQYQSQLDILIDALIHMGEYEQALSLSEDNIEKLHINSLIRARDKDDNEWCKCNIETAVMEQVWSTKHNAFIYHHWCLLCGDRNISRETSGVGND